MWVYWQGVRVHIEHIVHARELDFLVKDDLVGREVTMVHFFKFSAPSNDLRSTESPSMNSSDILTGAISEAASAAAPLKLASSVHMGYDEPMQDETIVRIKVFL